MKLTPNQVKFIQARRKYVRDLERDTGKVPPAGLSIEMHIYNALIDLHNNE